MITANELRIGDYVFELEYLKVKSISETGVNGDANGVNYPFDMLSGIPITPEILEKCGFEYWTLDHDCTDPKDAYWVHKKLKFSINNLSWKVQKLNVSVKYLHQLQNLYFSLTGEELIINL